jgi:hypothetical protein
MAEDLTSWTKAEQAAGDKLAAAWESFASPEMADPTTTAPNALEAAGHAAEAQHRHEPRLLAMENVVGVAPSLKMTGGKLTTTATLTVFVEKKKALSQVRKDDRVPAEVDGVPTDVIESGRFDALAFTGQVRPALPGFSIGHHNITAGTFGALVRDIRRCDCHDHDHHDCHHDHHHCPGPSDDYLILSNNHVLANTNAAQIGDAILQPGPFDGGLFPSDTVATLERFEPIVFGASGYNLVDAALARPTHSRNVTASLIGEVIPRGIDQATVGMGVIKVGRTTQVTTGTVLAVNATVAVNYGAPGVGVFRHQILTTAMSAGGDSGSLLMSRELNAVGLLYAGSAVLTIHNHIADVESALGVRPVTAPRSG